MRAWFRHIVAGLAFTCTAGAFAQVPVPPATSHVVDQTGSFETARAAALDARLADFERQHGAQVAVLIVPTTAPETIDQFGIRVADQWRIGRHGADDGAIVLIASNDRAARIEVGYGLEGVLTDAVSHRILAETMAPRLRAGDIAGGVEAGVDRILATLASEPVDALSDDADDAGDRTLPTLMTVSMMAVAIGGLLRRWLGRARAVGWTALAAGLLAGWLAGSLAIAVLAALIAAVVTHVGVVGWLPWGATRREASFRGKGGGFGGGGASGRW